MQFYKIQVELMEPQADDEDRKARIDMARKIAIRTAQFNDGDNEKYCFVSDIDNDTVTMGILTRCFIDPSDLADQYAAFIGLTAKETVADEITLDYLQRLLSDADRQSYIEDDNKILDRFDLRRLDRGIEFGEALVNEGRSKDELIKLANKCLMRETLVPELERIYAGRKSLHVSGHPVHYIVETDDRDTRREVYKIILDALRANQRLDNRRYAFLDFHPGENYSEMAYETLYKISEGGTVVVRYLADDDTEEDETASGERDTIENICEMAKLYRNKVLTVICLPRECKKAKSIFYEYLGTMAFVEVKEDFIEGEDTKHFLTNLAKEHHIRADQKLFAKLISDKLYLATELQAIFNEWYDDKLKNTIYPQYKDIAVARKEVVKAQPKGSAYDELTEMVGLTEAKQVIKKALNYYKMQKLYEEKGVKRDHPAMHMVFSGNPGTAKTTVARLFARIVRENGLLSKGQLIEVGRGDLVGKYVGWTAQTVQAKFKAAIGGVLFIDEAYSLVDDRSGSYGDEAINTIVQEMENHRADVVVIFAGYPDKMEGFLQKNPGLRSRIAFHVPFADYDSGELCQIAQLLSSHNGMRWSEEAMSKLEAMFDMAKAQNDFGNGRYVRNVFEQAKMNQATRLLEKDFESIKPEEVLTITADDIILPTVVKSEKRKIGFC